MSLDLTADPVELTAALVDIPSESGNEAELAGQVAAALERTGLEVVRSGNAVLARTDYGLPSRVVFAGHLDTVPINDNLPVRRAGSMLYGCGTVDMKGGDAIMLHLAQSTVDGGKPLRDMTFVFYDCEEVEATRNGLLRIEQELPAWLDGDLAVVGEPSGGRIEAGCQGTLRVVLRVPGERAHTARAWQGVNAIHGAAEILTRLRDYQPRQVDIDGCRYREGLQAVRISGGVAGNVVPDECLVAVNFRFAPDRSAEQALEHVAGVFDGFAYTVEDLSPGALPGMAEPAAMELADAAGGDVAAKLGWTDVARFAARGLPAVNFGPGDASLAHTKDEHVPVAQITRCADVLRRFCFG